MKTMPCPAAHPCIGDIREYPPPPTPLPGLNPGLSQILSKVFLSKNMHHEHTKYYLAFTPRYSNDNTKYYSKQYLGW